MQMNKMKKLQRLTVLCTIMALVITGCGKTTDSKEKNVAQEVSDIDSEKDHEGQTLSAMLKVDEEKWVEEFEVAGGNLHTIKIGATVEIPDVTGMSMLALEDQEFDAAGKKALLEAVCTEGEIYSFDDSKMPKWFYERLIKSDMEQVEDILAAKENGTSWFSDGSWGSEDEQYLEEVQQYLDENRQAYEEAPENGYDVGDYSAENYTGMTDKGRVTMYFHSDENSVSWNVGNTLDFSQKPELTTDAEIGLFIGEMDYGNLCKMSEEEAKNYAVSFAAKLGYEEYVASDIKYLTWQDYKSENWEQWTDGYVVTLAREIDGVPVDYTNLGSRQYWRYGVGEYIQLQFNDAGMIHGEIYHPRKLKEVTTKNTLLLPYKQIKDVMKSILTEKAEDYGKEIEETESSISFSDMELVYYSLTDEEQGVLVIPAWRLSSLESEEATGYKNAMHPLVINAIDGSWIDVWEGMEPSVIEETVPLEG